MTWEQVERACIDGMAVTHDDRGNMLSGKLTPASSVPDTLTWDYANRLTGGSIGGVAFTNTYNGLGHRVSTVRGGVTTGFVIDGSLALSQIMAETNADGALTAFYLYAGNGLAARILPDGTALYYHTDRSGSVALVSDGAGSIAAHYHYDPFGVLLGSSGSFANSNPFRYLGGWAVYDNNDGTLHARARTYHADLGRFLSRDPLFGNQADGQSLNRYVYALNDPLGLVDTTGLSAHTALMPSFYFDTRNANSTAPYLQRSFGPPPIRIRGYHANSTDAVNTAAEGPFDRLFLDAAFLGIALAEPTPAGEAAFLARLSSRGASQYVYRAVRPDELVTIESGIGLVRGSGGTTATQQVLGVRHATNPWISTTRSVESAEFFATHGGTQPAGTIIRIDLNSITNPVLDVSNPSAAASILRHPRAINFSAAHQEVLIQGGIPSEAITIFK